MASDGLRRQRAGTGTMDRPKTDENVFLFVPNLIGYSRILLTAISLVWMPRHPKSCFLLYSVGALLDAVDGKVARALGQASMVGSLLDMLTDRCATTCLLCFLSSSYPSWQLLFQFLITLDFSSHWLQMYATLKVGGRSHKVVTKEHSRIMHAYYTNTNVLFFVCACAELFYLALYLAAWYPTPLGLRTRWVVSQFPRDLREQIPIDLLHFFEKLSWPKVVATACAPVWLFKQVVNVIQLAKAAKQVADLDREERYVLQHQKTQ